MSSSQVSVNNVQTYLLIVSGIKRGKMENPPEHELEPLRGINPDKTNSEELSIQ